jgi:hypothetical protein
VRPRHDAKVLGRVGLIEIHIGCHDRQLAAPGHGVAGVHREVHDDLLDLPGIDQRLLEIGRGGDRQLHVFADDAVEQVPRPDHDVVEVDDPRAQHLLAAEGQELTREPRGALPGRLDLLDVGADRVVGREIPDQHRAIAEDDGEQVVEVVGDAPGELAERVHLLRGAELVL